jgi:hypothetical protein
MRQRLAAKTLEVEMLAGTVVMEDLTLHYRVQPGQERVLYTVCDSHCGEGETVDCDAHDFMLALGIALSFDGEGLGNPQLEQMYPKFEAVQPLNRMLRWIP